MLHAFPVLIGVTLATALVHLASVGIGALLGAALPTRPINAVAAVAFVVFGLWTLRGDELTDDDEVRANKTMLATITLATCEGVIGTWLGSTIGMVIASSATFFVFAVLLGYEAVWG